MKYFKLAALTLTLIGSINTSATHLLGGEITWECQGNGDYIFTMILYRECGNLPGGGPPTGLGPTESIQFSGGSSIVVNRLVQPAGIIQISPVCNGPNGIACGSTTTSGGGAVERHTYKSQPVSLAGPIPVAGWTFSFGLCCRPASVQNTPSSDFYIQTVMYSGANDNGCAVNSPRFLTEPLTARIKNGLGSMVQTVSSYLDDSIHYDFTNSLEFAGIPVMYNAGYSSIQPFPNVNTDMANGLTTIDHATGLITYDVVTGTTGSYAYAIMVEQWRNHVLLSRVMRDFPLVFLDGATNNEPTLTIDTIANPNIQQNGRTYYLEVYAGDTIDFNIHGTDTDSNLSAPNGYQSITFKIDLDSTVSYSLPTVTPVGPQTSFIDTLTNTVNFYWETNNSHYLGANSDHVISFEFADDACPAPERNFATLRIKVRSTASIIQDSVITCTGDSIKLNGHTRSSTYLWTNANGPIVNSSVQNPYVSPLASGYVYLQDAVFTQFIDSVYVEVLPLDTFKLIQQNGVLYLDDQADSGTVQWYYNGIPIPNQLDSLPLVLPGNYWVEKVTTYCHYRTDTITANQPFNFAVLDMTNGKPVDSLTGSATNSLGIEFSVDQATIGYLESFSIGGVYAKSGKKAQNQLRVKILGSSGVQLYSSGKTINSKNWQVVSFSLSNLRLIPNQLYTLIIEGDSALEYQLFENITTPFNPNGGGLTISRLLTGQIGIDPLPIHLSDKSLPVSFKVFSTISVSEFDQVSFSIYPNPAQDEVVIELAEEFIDISVSDLTGRSIPLKWALLEKGLYKADISQLKAGIYSIAIKTKDGSMASQKLIVE